MVVLTQDKHPGHAGIVGLHIGAMNVEEYFPPHVETVELELDHLRIVCLLKPSFWQGEPHIHDLRLSSWLESKRNSGKLAAQPAPVTLIPSGEHTFRLQLMAKEDAAQPSTAEPGVVFASKIGPQPVPPLEAVLPSMNRRKFSGGQASGQDRRVARLKSDDRLPTPANH